MLDNQLYNLTQYSSNDIRIFIEDWVNYISLVKRYSLNTVESYVFDLVNFVKFQSEYKAKIINLDDLKKFDVKDIRAFLAKRKIDNKCNASNRRVISGISSFFAFLCDKKILQENIVSEIKRPKTPKNLPHPAEFKDIMNIINLKKSNINWIDDRDTFLYVLIYATGIRISEALSLKICDFKDDHLIIYGKGRKERVVPILEIVFNYFFAYINSCPYIYNKTRNSNEMLFWGKNGKILNRTFCVTLIKRFSLQMQSDSKITPHSLRHSFATHLIQNNANIRAVEEMLGHQSLSTTEKYTKLVTDDILKAYSSFHPFAKKNK